MNTQRYTWSLPICLIASCLVLLAGFATPVLAQDALPDSTTEPGTVEPVDEEWLEMMSQPILAPLPEADPDAWLQDPFKHLTTSMDVVVDELAAKITEDPVPGQQEQIVADLDQLIEMLEKACSAGSGAGAASANPTRPANESTLAAGPGGQGELIAPKDSRHEWADLPPNEREEILQSSTEDYPPGYREAIEDYFNRLAVERTVSEDTPDEDTE